MIQEGRGANFLSPGIVGEIRVPPLDPRDQTGPLFIQQSEETKALKRSSRKETFWY